MNDQKRAIAKKRGIEKLRRRKERIKANKVCAWNFTDGQMRLDVIDGVPTVVAVSVGDVLGAETIGENE